MGQVDAALRSLESYLEVVRSGQNISTKEGANAYIEASELTEA
jgi:hypothetical protein